jgi:hypothetical protein
MFKVVCPITRRDGGGTYWMRIGSGFTNKDDSINVYIDAIPRDMGVIQLRALEPADLRPRVTSSTVPSSDSDRAVSTNPPF